MAQNETLARWGQPSAETLRFRDAIERLLADAPPPEAIDVVQARRLRAEGKLVTPVNGPTEAGRWQPLPEALGSGTGRVRLVEVADPQGVYLHIHGGGWVLGAPDQFDGRHQKIGEAARMTVVSVHYRLAPEHLWPACAEDCMAAALWALDYAAERGIPLAIGGESAGAHLSAVTLLKLRDVGRLNEVAAAVLLYGCYDMRGTPSVLNWGEKNLILSTPIVKWFANAVLGDADPAAPSVSPLMADLSRMPPALFICGDQDPLLDDSLFMAERWRAAGGRATLQIWPGAIHAFDYFDDPGYNLPIAAQCQQRIVDYLIDAIRR